MYERFYGLYRPPFAVTPDPSLLYMSRTHREALATIIYGVETRKGFIVCTGEVGTGKTTVIRAFFDQAQADTFKIVYIFAPQVSPLEMAKFICRELGMAEPDSVFAAVPALQLKLLDIFEGGRTVVLMVDEAQLLPAQTLEFLRLLSNFETDTEKLIQIVLVGQSEVDAMLARRDMRQVNQRVALRARLSALSLEESLDYIGYRLAACGAAELGQVLSPGAAWAVADAAGGIPRCINIFADNVLIAGFGADQRPVGGHLATATMREFINNSGGNSAGNSGIAFPRRPRRFGLRRRQNRSGGAAPEIAPPEKMQPWWPATETPLEPPIPEPAPVPGAATASGMVAPQPEAVPPRFLGARAARPFALQPTIARLPPLRIEERFRLRPRGSRTADPSPAPARRSA